MFTKIALATAIVLGAASGAVAMSKNPAYDVHGASRAVTTGSTYIGSDPDPLVRAQLAHDPSQGD